VNLQWTSFDASAPGGYGELRDVWVSPRRGRRVPIEQGDLVTGYRQGGRIAYQGKVEAPAKYTGDVAIISVMGPRSTVDGFTDRLPYQIRDASAFQEMNADPAHYVVSENWAIASRGNTIGVKQPAQSPMASGDELGYYLFVDGYPVQRVAFTIRNPVGDPSVDLKLGGANGLGGRTVLNTWTLSAAANPDGTARDVAVAGSYDTILLYWRRTAAGTPTTNRHWWLDDLRVGIITDQDTFTTADVASDVANRCGYASFTSGSLNILPLDWDGAATDLLDYMAAIEDQTWLVLADATGRHYGKLFFRPWGHKVWHTHIADTWAEDQGLTILPLYDAITTTYDSPHGMHQSKRSKVADFGIPDPLPGRTVDYPQPLQISDPQPDATLALAMNQRALARLTKLRLQGTLLVHRVRLGEPFDILPGDMIKIGDFSPDVPPQRIANVTYNRDGTAALTLDRDLHLDHLVLRVSHRRRHPHHGHR